MYSVCETVVGMGIWAMGMVNTSWRGEHKTRGLYYTNPHPFYVLSIHLNIYTASLSYVSRMAKIHKIRPAVPIHQYVTQISFYFSRKYM